MQNRIPLPPLHNCPITVWSDHDCWFQRFQKWSQFWCWKRLWWGGFRCCSTIWQALQVKDNDTFSHQQQQELPPFFEAHRFRDRKSRVPARLFNTAINWHLDLGRRLKFPDTIKPSSLQFLLSEASQRVIEAIDHHEEGAQVSGAVRTVSKGRADRSLHTYEGETSRLCWVLTLQSVHTPGHHDGWKAENWRLLGEQSDGQRSEK